MSIRYIQSGDEPAGSLLAGGQIDDGTDSWWAGAQLCFARVALAAAVAASTLSATIASDIQQDAEEIPAGSLRNQPDEDFWPPYAVATGGMPLIAFAAGGAQGLVTALPPTLSQRLPYLPEPDEIPAGLLRAQPEEDFWQNPTPPVSPAIFQRLPYLPEPEEIPAGSLRRQPDEDFWQNAVAPVPPSIFQRLPYLPEPEEIPAGSLRGQPDEDFWPPSAAATGGMPPIAFAAGGAQGLVTAVPPAIFQRLPYLPEPEEIPAGSLRGQPDEDFWLPSAVATGGAQGLVTVAPPSVYQLLPVTGGEPAEIIAIPVLTPDEDFWINPAAPLAPTLYQPLPYLPDPSEEPAQFHWIELDWYADPTATSTVGYNIYRGTAGPGSEGSTPINPSPVDVGASPNSLCTYNDCNIQWGITYWYVVYSYDTSTGLQSTTPTNEISASYPPVIDEDFWQNPVAPVPPSVYQPLPIVAGESAEIVPAVVFQPDEDFWGNPVAPVPPTTLQRLPYAATDVEELPAGSLHGQPDEDFWQNPVAPVPPCGPKPSGGGPPALYGQLPYLPEVSDEPSGSLHGQPDEDFWANPVAPVPATVYQRPPYLPELSDEPAGSLYGQPDEDFWANGVALPTFCRAEAAPRPYLPDLGDDPAGSLYGQPDEDFWADPVAPTPPSVYQRLPYASPDPEEVSAGSLINFKTPDEDYWPPSAVATEGAQGLVTVAPPSIYQPLPIAAGEPGEIVPTVVFQPDGDYWQNPVVPIPAALWRRLPYLPDLSDEPAGSLYGQPDEDFWANPVAPIPPIIFQRLPYLPELSDDPAGSLHILTEETEWLNWVAPVGASVWQPLPSAWGFDDFSSSWWTSRWGVNTHSMARERISRSTDRERTSRSTARTRTSRGVSRQSSVVSS
jgi:hypothetical protein